ncbi:hypothetical protein [Nitrosomonas sp. Is79A3]|uniref:hypothetical protein n=1 Tax=Nitrosomonas sp. (strain Is79A3) TaxID=261292 RepID=UPI0012EA855C
MRCTVKDLPPLDPNLSPDELRMEWDRIAKENMESVDRLMASKSLVEICNDPVPTDGLIEGMPVRWGDEHHVVPIFPHGDNDTFEFGIIGAGLK